VKEFHREAMDAMLVTRRAGGGPERSQAHFKMVADELWLSHALRGALG
jgi:hypothetical protein